MHRRHVQFQQNVLVYTYLTLFINNGSGTRGDPESNEKVEIDGQAYPSNV